MRYGLFLPILVLMLSGCASSSTRMVNSVQTYSDGACNVTVYQTKAAAEKSGLSEEVCVVDGSSSFSWDHSIEGAIKNNIGDVCACGVTKAYVQSASSDSSMGVKSVSRINLVGFK